MTDFLSSLRADLLDRRLLPLVALVVVALVAAVAYAVLAGGSGASTPTAVAPTAPPVTAPAGLSISHATPETAVAEVTSGAGTQHRGVAHDPFAPLAGASEKTSTPSVTGSATGAASSSSAASESSSSSSSASEPAPASTPTPSTPAKPKTVYHVAILFGEVPPASSGQTAQLTPYVSLKLLTPLPSAKRALVVFRGVTAGSKSATFTLVGEAILHGPAACLPSASQCEAIDLHSGQSETLEYLPSAGPAVTYELTLVSITSTKASSADVANVLRTESKAGRQLLHNDGLVAIPDLRDSSQVGVLVFAGHSAFGHASSHGDAHAAGRSHRGR
jgi:hypothetical protein